MKKAIYFFAGGTAATLEEFSQRECDSQFRNAKGPDFVSRLRGKLDVAGPNAEPRMLRRAVILRSELHKRVMRTGKSKVRFEPELLKALLRVGRYRHGARSITALAEIITLDEAQDPLGWDMLPDDLLVALQVDRGPLDPRVIGGPVALSGFATQEAGSPDVGSLQRCWIEVARELWDEGATLAYAGQIRSGDRDFSKLLIDELKNRPSDLSRNKEFRSNPRARFLSFLADRHNISREAAEAAFLDVQPRRLGYSFVEAAYLDEQERQWLNDSKRDTDRKLAWEARAIERFRRRLAVTEASVARFVIGGDPRPHGNRPSGVVEEAILSLALKQPIYVAGGFGGAAADLGVVLGLSTVRTGAIPDSLKSHLEPEEEQWLLDVSDRLRPPPLAWLPVLPHEQVEFLHQNALGGGLWVWNGLTPDDNRRLFQSNNVNEVAQLVIKGMLKRFTID